MQDCDEVVRGVTGKSVLAVLYDPGRRRSDPLDSITVSHPAVFMIEYSLARVLIGRGVVPAYHLGASLGEYAAIAATGVIGWKEMLEFIVRQAALIEKKCPAGGLLSVFSSVETFHANRVEFEGCELAGTDYDTHFVVSGRAAALDKAAGFLGKKDVITWRLPVRYPFHSSLMDSIRKDFAKITPDCTANRKAGRILSCATGGETGEVTGRLMWEIIRNPIRVSDTIRLAAQYENPVFVDLGPCGTLSGFVNNTRGFEGRGIHVFSRAGSDADRLEAAVNSIVISGGRTTSKRKAGQRMKTYLFPGQGSQKKGMGGSLFDEFRDMTDTADAVLGYSIKRLCTDDPDGLLGQTLYSQPAIFTVNALNFRKTVQSDGMPDFFAGHSLGEYSALCAAGAFDFETGLRLVKKRGEIMSRAKGGGMAAVIGLDEERVKRVIEDENLTALDIANYNSPSQIVISGPADDIRNAEARFMHAGARLYSVLAVSGAFHSRYMKESAAEFAAYVRTVGFGEIRVPVISNVYARPYVQSDIAATLGLQIDHPVKWNESIRYLMGKGALDFKEIGGGSIVFNMTAKILKEATPLVIEDVIIEEIPKAEPAAVGETHTPESAKAALSDATAVQSESVTGTLVLGDKPVDGTTMKRKSGFSFFNRNGNKRKELPFTGLLLRASDLGSRAYRDAYGLQLAYSAGAMGHGISSSSMVIALAKAGMLGYFGTSGLSMERIEREIELIHRSIGVEHPFGVNITCDPANPAGEAELVDLCIKHAVRHIDVSRCVRVTLPLAGFRIKGLKKGKNGRVLSTNRIQAKLSRPEVAASFLGPAPDDMIRSLLSSGGITEEQAWCARRVPVATEICAESDSGGHASSGVATVLVPAIARLAEENRTRFGYADRVCIGACGDIGTPEAVAAAFMLGADYVQTGSINQCTVEAGTSDVVKRMLAETGVQDTAYAPSPDMSDPGGRIRVLRKGVFFPGRANKLYDVLAHCRSLADIEPETRRQFEERYFKKSIAGIVSSDTSRPEPGANGRRETAGLFAWYYDMCMKSAIAGDEENKVNFLVHCGPAMGAFNGWVKGTELEGWKSRHVDEIGKRLMDGAAEYLNRRTRELHFAAEKAEAAR